jgi:hypothetical protein
MGKIVLAALVGIWLFNLARLIAGGLPGHVPGEGNAAYAAQPSAAAMDFAVTEPALPAGVAVAIRSAKAAPGAQSSISVGLMLAEPAIVYVDLYDLAGRRILTQTSRRLPAGRSSVQLNSVERLMVGNYWIRARVGDQVATTSVAIHG